MNDQHDQYKELAGGDAYVEKLRKKLEKQNWDRLTQQVARQAMEPHLSIAERKRKPSLRTVAPLILGKRRAHRALQAVAYMRQLVYNWYAKQDAQDEPKALNPREYAAARLLRISRVLGTYKHIGSTIGGETKWVPGRDLEAVLHNGDRTPATVGKVLGLIDWFKHCLAAFEGRSVAPAVKPVKITVLSPLEQVLGNWGTKEDPFTVEDLNKLAHAAGLATKERQFCLGVRKKGAVTGFCEALIVQGKLKGPLETTVPIVGKHFGVDAQRAKSEAMRWSRNDGQKKDVYFFCYGSKYGSKNRRGVARQTA